MHPLRPERFEPLRDRLEVARACGPEQLERQRALQLAALHALDRAENRFVDATSALAAAHDQRDDRARLETELRAARTAVERRVRRDDRIAVREHTRAPARLQVPGGFREAEMDLARRIQIQLLPERMPKVTGLDSWASSRPASRVGGDFYTAVEQSNEAFTFAVGDISGKGLPAAILMAMTRTILRSNTTTVNPVKPAGIIDISNRELYDDFSEVSMFATVFVGQYQPISRSLSYANAGHSPVVYLPAGGKAQLLLADSTPMGIEAKNEAVDKELVIQGGDVLVVASDGLNEARNGQNEMFGYNRLLRLIEDLADKPARQISADLFRAVDEFSAGRSQDDDQTVVVLKGEPR